MLTTYDYKQAIAKLDKEFGDSWKEWLPETLEAAIDSAWRGISPIHFDRLLAIRNLLKQKRALTNVDAFEATINAVNWNNVSHEARIAPSPGQIVFAMRIIRDLLPEDEIVFTSDVLKYMAEVFNSRGYSYVPEEFGIPQDVQGYIDMYDGSIEFREAVKTKWRAMMDGKWFDLEETPVDVQCARLLAIKKFCDFGGSGTPRDKENALTRLMLR